MRSEKRNERFWQSLKFVCSHARHISKATRQFLNNFTTMNHFLMGDMNDDHHSWTITMRLRSTHSNNVKCEKTTREESTASMYAILSQIHKYFFLNNKLWIVKCSLASTFHKWQNLAFKSFNRRTRLHREQPKKIAKSVGIVVGCCQFYTFPLLEICTQEHWKMKHSTLRVPMILLFGTIIWEISIDCGIAHNLQWNKKVFVHILYFS